MSKIMSCTKFYSFYFELLAKRSLFKTETSAVPFLNTTFVRFQPPLTLPTLKQNPEPVMYTLSVIFTNSTRSYPGLMPTPNLRRRRPPGVEQIPNPGAAGAGGQGGLKPPANPRISVGDEFEKNLHFFEKMKFPTLFRNKYGIWWDQKGHYLC